MRKLLRNVDTWAGLAAITWAVLALMVLPDLAKLVSYEVAFGFGVLALGRALAHARRKALPPANDNG